MKNGNKYQNHKKSETLEQRQKDHLSDHKIWVNNLELCVLCMCFVCLISLLLPVRRMKYEGVGNTRKNTVLQPGWNLCNI